MKFRPLASFLLLAALAGLGGCAAFRPAKDPVRYFTLSFPAAALEAAGGGVDVRPVNVAGHLRSRSLAVRVSAHEVTYLDEARWAEPLDEALTQILRTRLAAPGRALSLSVQVQRCELVRAPSPQVEFAATYTVRDTRTGRVSRGAFRATPRPWAGADQGELVALLRASADEFAEHLAGALRGE